MISELVTARINPISCQSNQRTVNMMRGGQQEQP